MRIILNPKANLPPSGKWSFQLGDDYVESPVYDIAVRRVGELLAKHGVKADAVTALAEYMCPRLPPWMCRGDGPSLDLILGREAQRNALPYFPRQVETVDVIVDRMQRCQRCPMHRRDFCLHCTGYDTWIYNGFGGPRPKLPVDDASGCCRCARTFEAVIASVCYKSGEKIWEGVPDTCWRRTT